MKNLLPLPFLDVSRKAVIKEIIGGKKCRQRLQAMGLNIGSSVQLIQNDISGPVIVSTGECRVGVGRSMAQKIMVEEVSVQSPVGV